MKDWAPDSVTEAASQHIGYYLAINNVPGKALTISDTPRYGDDGSLSFEFTTDAESSTYTTTVQTTDYGGGISSSTVTVNGDSTDYAVAPRLYGARFSDFDSLINTGFTAIQVYEIQTQLMRFSESGSFGIDTSTISQNPSGTGTKTTFDIIINGGTYKLIDTSSGILNSHVVLLKEKGGQVFDSGSVTIAN